ncbi:MFS transporter [Ancylobacter vacuolatus]|uniref:MHS family proline/betaine transporter-like MFS transporter n=1 Tax=Ancylobacter vacuolatus TaxID=223389 RepID=A0ABU0DMF8_9HYPH|nr:MFS transporter [Ancylobacter vacuolatus]MDQ0349621.1 MHS family proline/betaine transporter-like MFS transporter [Ancylobacter vacuolatus]
MSAPPPAPPGQGRFEMKPAASGPTARSGRRAFIGVLLCNVLEWYDFVIYGLLAVHLSRAFFPQESDTVALLATLAVFGVSFVMRPLGGLLLGGLGDSQGRKPALMIAAILMAAGTFAIGLLPTFEAIGVFAPVLLLVARLVQGFSAGGEWGIANAFLLETSPEGRRGFSTSFLSVTVALGSGLASAVAALLVTALSPENMEDWGWRMPFLLGGTLGIVALWLRSGIDETPVYRRVQAARASAGTVLRRIRRPGLTVLGFTMHWTVCYYVFLIYMPLFTQRHAGLSAAQATWSNTICIASIILLVPLIGRLSDRYGRRPFLLCSCLLVLALVVPAMWAIVAFQSFPLVVGVQVLFGVTIALYSGPAPAVVAELFLTPDRSRWSSVSYAMAAAIFGGFAPFIAVWLTAMVDNPLAPAGYVIAAGATSLLVVWRMPETAHMPIS